MLGKAIAILEAEINCYIAAIGGRLQLALGNAYLINALFEYLQRLKVDYKLLMEI